MTRFEYEVCRLEDLEEANALGAEGYSPIPISTPMGYLFVRSCYEHTPDTVGVHAHTLHHVCHRLVRCWDDHMVPGTPDPDEIRLARKLLDKIDLNDITPEETDNAEDHPE